MFQRKVAFFSVEALRAGFERLPHSTFAPGAGKKTREVGLQENTLVLQVYFVFVCTFQNYLEDVDFTGTLEVGQGCIEYVTFSFWYYTS